MLNAYSHVVGFDMFNWGAVAAWSLDEPPPGSWANPYPVNYFAASGVAWAPAVVWMSSLYEAFGRLYWSRGFVEEVAARMPSVQIGGLRVAYERAGEGPSLVLLPGFLSDSRAWRPQLADLSDEFTVIAWDPPGAGGSTARRWAAARSAARRATSTKSKSSRTLRLPYPAP